MLFLKMRSQLQSSIALRALSKIMLVFLINEILLRGEVERSLSTLRSINAGENFYKILFVTKIICFKPAYSYFDLV